MKYIRKGTLNISDEEAAVQELLDELRPIGQGDLPLPPPVPKMSSLGIDFYVGKLNPAKVRNREIEGSMSGQVEPADAPKLVRHGLGLSKFDEQHLGDLYLTSDGSVIRWQEVQSNRDNADYTDEFDRGWQIELRKVDSGTVHMSMAVLPENERLKQIGEQLPREARVKAEQLEQKRKRELQSLEKHNKAHAEMRKRATLGLCVNCGKKITSGERIFGKTRATPDGRRHETCWVFIP